MAYRQRVRVADGIIEELEQSKETLSDHDQHLLRAVRKYRELMSHATSAYEARIPVSALSRFWIDSGDWDGAFSEEIKQLLVPVRESN